MIYFQLMREFLKIGLFAIGGGLASLPFLKDISVRMGWFSAEDIIRMIAISESTPGPIGINMATYVGYLTGGPLGGAAATLSVIAPSVVIIILVARILDRFLDNQWVKAAFYGLRPAVTALIAVAFLDVAKVAFLNDTGAMQQWLPGKIQWGSVGIFLILFALILRYKKHPVVYISASAVLGIICHMA